jgi:hypothetical protein
LHTGNIEEEEFWEITKEADLEKSTVEDMITPFSNHTIREQLDS